LLDPSFINTHSTLMRSLKPNNVADSVGGAVEVKGAELRVDGD